MIKSRIASLELEPVDVRAIATDLHLIALGMHYGQLVYRPYDKIWRLVWGPDHDHIDMKPSADGLPELTQEMRKILRKRLKYVSD